MRVALYARVSTNDKDQNTETQLLPLREYCKAKGWEVYREYVDEAKANDLPHRTAWKSLMEDAAKHRFQSVVVFKLDRAFRSVRHMMGVLDDWEVASVGFVSIREQYDFNTPMGRLMRVFMAALAEFELETISERVKAGMSRARNDNKQIGRPDIGQYYWCDNCEKLSPPAHFQQSHHAKGSAILEVMTPLIKEWRAGELSISGMSRMTRLSRRTLARFLRDGQKGYAS